MPAVAARLVVKTQLVVKLLAVVVKPARRAVSMLISKLLCCRLLTKPLRLVVKLGEQVLCYYLNRYAADC